jgi:hypothetical protein
VSVTATHPQLQHNFRKQHNRKQRRTCSDQAVDVAVSKRIAHT